ncbi:MAG TPA: VWA domain-containing protein, partial [Thermoplasmata archaeon]|nr:VWA domain-containing protein [Thermoplasmata archaeon]
MALSKIVLVLLAAAVIVPLNAGDTSWTRGGDAPQPLSIDLAAVKPTFTQCEEVVVRVYNPGPGDVGFSEPPMLHIFTASGDPVTNPYSDLTVVWTLPAGDSEDFTWDQTYDLVVAGIPDARNGDPVPLGDYYAVFGLADMNGNLPGPAPFSIVPCLSVDAGADQSIDEGESVDLSLQVNLDANSTLLSVSWDLDAAADADGNGNATDDADLVGPNVTAVFGDDGGFDVTANARVSTNSTTVSKVDQDVLFLIDSSGSMQWNDPSNLRLTASKAYVDQLTPDDRAAVIDFDTEAFLVPQPDHINPGDHLSMNYAKVKQNIDLVDSFGGTEFRDAFRLMNKEFSTRGDPTHVWVGIFLTDAQSISINDMLRFPQTLNETVKLGIRVFPVGLSVPEELHGFTMNIANVTGGQYFPSPSPEDLEEVYANISSAVESGGEAIQVLTDTLHVSVGNVAPSLAVDVESISGGGNLTLRVAGEKFHDVTATLYRDDVPVETVSIGRVPGSPNEQA